MNLPVILVIIFVVAAAVWMLLKKRAKRAARILAIEDRVYPITNKRQIPNSFELWLEKGADGPTEAEIAAMENGLARCFEKARRQGYDRPLNLGDYKIAIVNSIRAPESHLWSYKLPVGPYAGTEWDLGGYILAAGQMVAVGEPYGNILAIPDHHGTDLEELSLILEYEAEHVILAFCDPEKFEATKVHGAGQGHPLF